MEKTGDGIRRTIRPCVGWNGWTAGRDISVDGGGKTAGYEMRTWAAVASDAGDKIRAWAEVEVRNGRRAKSVGARRGGRETAR